MELYKTWTPYVLPCPAMIPCASVPLAVSMALSACDKDGTDQSLICYGVGSFLKCIGDDVVTLTDMTNNLLSSTTIWYVLQERA